MIIAVNCFQASSFQLPKLENLLRWSFFTFFEHLQLNVLKAVLPDSAHFGSPRNEIVTRRKSATKKKHRQTNIATPFSSELITYNASTICRRHYPAALLRIGRSTIVQVHTTNCNSINTINITAIGTVVKGTTIPSGKGVDSAQAFTTLKLKG